jgi:radical SAM superfamily enzyme YgiQ (UPF0313 family)
MSVKVALVNPGKDARYATQEPLHLGFLASYLEKNNTEVRIIDELAGQDVKREIEKYGPKIVGITATTPVFPDACDIADECRKNGILTVMGGVHVSVMPDEALEHADIVVKGEGEQAIVDIVNNHDIDSRIISRPYIKNLDDIPPPARHLMDMEFYLKVRDRITQSYLHFVPPFTPTASILTSRGCPYDCVFCHNTWKNMPFRFHSAERVIAEIEELKQTYSIGALFFIEDNLFVNKKRLLKICAEMKSRNIAIPWGANSRVDHVDLDFFKSAKDAGCEQITFGFESGSQNVLDTLRKKTTVEQNVHAIEVCNQLGIIPQGTIIIGNPGETLEDLEKTKAFIQNSAIESVGICIATPFPGTQLWNWAEEQNRIPDTYNWSDFNYHNVPIPLCDAVDMEELKKVQLEMQFILLGKKKNKLKISEIVKLSLNDQAKAMNALKMALKSPAKIVSVLKRISL